jgi:hypothetical protein
MKDDTEYLRAADIAALTGMSIVAKADLDRLLSPSSDLTEEPDDGAE